MAATRPSRQPHSSASSTPKADFRVRYPVLALFVDGGTTAAHNLAASRSRDSPDRHGLSGHRGDLTVLVRPSNAHSKSALSPEATIRVVVPNLDFFFFLQHRVAGEFQHLRRPLRLQLSSHGTAPRAGSVRLNRGMSRIDKCRREQTSRSDSKNRVVKICIKKPSKVAHASGRADDLLLPVWPRTANCNFFEEPREKTSTLKGRKQTIPARRRRSVQHQLLAGNGSSGDRTSVRPANRKTPTPG